MKKAEVQIKIITPCLLAGTDQNKAELRPASIRGQLRWWFRLLNPGQREKEDAIFGTVHGKARSSSLVVRVKTPRGQIKIQEKKKARDIAGSDYDYFLWPLGRKNSTPRGYLEPNQSFSVSINHRHSWQNEKLPDEVLQAFLLFGSLGTRSRRAYGSIYPEKMVVDGESWSIPENLADFTACAKFLLQASDCTVLQIAETVKTGREAVSKCAEFLKCFRCGSDKNGDIPSKWGKSDHDAPFSSTGEPVYRQAIGLPLQQRYKNANYWSEAGNAERWASPLLLKVIPLGNKFLPFAVFCNSMVLPENTTIILADKQQRREVEKNLSLDLWQAMQNPNRHGEVGWHGAEKLV